MSFQHFVLVFLILFVLLAILWGSVRLGRYFGNRQLQSHDNQKLEVISVAEGAVFALLGLLLAFTFSGAYDRYEHRESHILEEANVFDSAYEVIALMPQPYQDSMRVNVRRYLDLHLQSYEDIPDLKRVDDDLRKAILVQHQIWKSVADAAKDNPNNGMLQVVAPVIIKMFDEFHSGINMARIHPPAVIFLLLIALAALGAFLMGYNAAESKEKHSIHILAYVFLTAFVIYLIMNLEFPRVGFIRYSLFDQMLADVRTDMNTTE